MGVFCDDGSNKMVFDAFWSKLWGFPSSLWMLKADTCVWIAFFFGDIVDEDFELIKGCAKRDAEDENERSRQAKASSSPEVVILNDTPHDKTAY